MDLKKMTAKNLKAWRERLWGCLQDPTLDSVQREIVKGWDIEAETEQIRRLEARRAYLEAKRDKY